MHTFSGLEGLRIAVEMERRGGAFYARAARFSTTEEARDALLRLSAEEKNHEREFSRLYAREQARGVECEPFDEETNAFLSAIAADIVFSGGLMALRNEGFDDPARVIEEAISSEKDSILFYTELADHTKDSESARVFGDIVRQERMHLLLLRARLSEIR